MRSGIVALVSTSQEQVCDLVSRACPESERTATKKFWVIGVSQNYEDVLRRRPVFRLEGHGFYELRITNHVIRNS